jgi:mRNA interferase MazF
VNPKPDEISLVGLGRVAKVRPAVVVSRDDPDSPRALSIFVPLTTENRGSDYEVSLGNPRFLNQDSWANHRGGEDARRPSSGLREVEEQGGFKIHEGPPPP